MQSGQPPELLAHCILPATCGCGKATLNTKDGYSFNVLMPQTRLNTPPFHDDRDGEAWGHGGAPAGAPVRLLPGLAASAARATLALVDSGCRPPAFPRLPTRFAGGTVDTAPLLGLTPGYHPGAVLNTQTKSFRFATWLRKRPEHNQFGTDSSLGGRWVLKGVADTLMCRKGQGVVVQ